MVTQPQDSLDKHFSVVVRLNQFAGLNGELAKLNTDSEREQFVREFFLKNYGEGAGKLEIKQKKNKVKLHWRPPRVVPEAETLHKTALAHAKNRNFVEAINSWVRAIALNTYEPDYYFNLGIAFFEIKNFKESIENLKKALELCPIYYKAHIILGTVYLKVRQFENAEHHLKESIKFYPKHALAFLNLGAVYSILKRYEEAIAMFNKTIELSPGEVRAYFGIAKIHALRNEFEQANEYFNKVIELDTSGVLAGHARKAMIAAGRSQPQTPVKPATETAETPADLETLYQEGYKAFLSSDYRRAIQLYKSYVSNRNDDDLVWFSLAEAYLRVGEVLEASKSYLQAIKLSPNKALYYKELALAYSLLGKHEDVVSCTLKAIQLGKSDSLTNSLKGKALYELQRYDEALEALSEAVRSNANNLLAKYYLARTYHARNEERLAKNYLHEIANSPINSPLKVDAAELLKEIGS